MAGLLVRPQVASQSYGNVTGRVTAIAIDPADATGNTVYVGATGGGVWKSTNAAGAATFYTADGHTSRLQRKRQHTGDPVVEHRRVEHEPGERDRCSAGRNGRPQRRDGLLLRRRILRSTDGGETWTLAQQSKDGVAGNHSFAGLSVAGFAWSTTTPGLVVAAFSQAADGTLVNAPDTIYSVMGLYYSTDAGVTWQMGLILDGSQVVQRPTPGGGPGNAATAVAWNPVRRMFYAAVRFHGYYQSPDGISWTRLVQQPGAGLTTAACPTNPNGTGSTACPIFRGALAVQTATGDTFALTVDANNLDQGLVQDVCALSGASCTNPSITFGKKLTSTPLEVGGGSTEIAQADYNLALAAVATGADTLLFAGTADLYRCSLAAGCVRCAYWIRRLPVLR